VAYLLFEVFILVLINDAVIKFLLRDFVLY